MTNETSERQCMVGGCHNIAVANDLCDKHRKRLERHGHVMDTRSSDWGARERHPLYRCWNALMRYHRHESVERWHDLWLFASDLGDTRPSKKHLLTRKNAELPYGPDNFYWREPRFTKSADKLKADADYMREWRKANMDKAIDGEMRKRYGITLVQYGEMLNAQSGVCAICGKEETRVDHRTKKVSRLAIDHDHSTGKVRGLLCHAHNNSLGHFGDDPTLLTSAVIYLAKHSENRAAVLDAAISQLTQAASAALAA